MPQNMSCTSAWASNAGTAHRFLDDNRDRTVRSERTKRRAGADKQSVDAGLSLPVFEVGDDRITNLLGQGQPRSTPPFPRNVKPGFLPVDIVKTQLYDITSPKAQACKQKENRTVSLAKLRRRIA
jgi:hypothetical protein